MVGAVGLEDGDGVKDDAAGLARAGCAGGGDGELRADDLGAPAGRAGVDACVLDREAEVFGADLGACDPGQITPGSSGRGFGLCCCLSVFAHWSRFRCWMRCEAGVEVESAGLGQHPKVSDAPGHRN